MNILWQNIPSTAFKTGLYGPSISLEQTIALGDFGVGAYESLDGEVTGLDGKFYRQVADGALVRVEPAELLCFSSVTTFVPTHHLELSAGLTEATVQSTMVKAFGTPNGIFAFRIDGIFDSVTTISSARLSPPWPTFDKVPHVSFEFRSIRGTLVCFYSPAFLGLTGIAGCHCHFLSEDRSGGGHVTHFVLRSGEVRWSRLQQFNLLCAENSAFDQADLAPKSPFATH